jgi:hypothetical protein
MGMRCLVVSVSMGDLRERMWRSVTLDWASIKRYVEAEDVGQAETMEETL